MAGVTGILPPSPSPSPKVVSDVPAGTVDPPQKRNTGFAIACALLASMTSILMGYDIGVMSGASIFIKDDLHISDNQLAVVMGILNLYSLIGSAAAGRTSDWVGRRLTIVIAAAFFFAGALLMGFAPNYAVLMLGRFVAGVGVGYALVIAPVYTAEVSPASSRGRLTSFPEVFINMGILLGYVSNFAFAKLPLNIGWRVMLGIGAVPSVFLGVGVLFMPESPRWLVMQGRLGEAKKVLQRTSDTKEEVLLRLAEIKACAGVPDDCDDDVVTVAKKSHGEGVWKELLISPTPAVRRILIAAVGIHFFQQASGIDSVVVYSPRVFEKAGLRSKDQLLGATVAVGFTKTVFILVATFMVDRFGRVPLLLTGMGGMVVTLAGLGLGLTVVDRHPDEKLTWAVALCIVSVLLYVAFFSIGPGPITWVYTSEIFPLRLRAQGASIGVGVNRVMSSALTMSFIELYKRITIGGCFFLYGGVAAVAWVFFKLYLPETRGKTLEEMEEFFGVTSKDHQCRNNEVDSGNGGGGGAGEGGTGSKI
ncbi:putative polyol transporter 5 [Iris pallida]|uniref:Polyol transporter 5 n=1 Tax=Iris pallida TaxID=29817 RepID=A0AAX6FAP5_IRIPA|nr:putative polyol transporter 5 [Iris pallida]